MSLDDMADWGDLTPQGCPYCSEPVDQEEIKYLSPNEREKVLCLSCNREFYVTAKVTYEIKKIEGSPE